MRGKLAFVLAVFTLSAEAWTQPAPQPLPRVRAGRIIGVFDDATGRALEGATVEDVISGWSSTTSATGTVSLFFVDTGGTLVRVRKPGYAPQLFAARNSGADTIPMTVVLKPVGQMLPAAVTTARSSRGPADTVRRLDLIGFYDRRTFTAAPTSAFITADRIAAFTLISDIPRISGREYCLGNLYVDGMLVTVPDFEPAHGVRTQPLIKKGIDFLINPAEIAAIEFYKPSDVPSEYNRTAAAQACGATLIWTK